MAASKPSLMQRTLTAVARSARLLRFVVPWTLHLLAADIVLSALLPVAMFLPDLAYNLSSSIAESVWAGIQTICERNNNANIIVEGDELPHGESAIVIANHREWTDFYLIQKLAINAGMLGRSRWFVKQELKWVPFLGWGLWAMGMPMVSRKWTQDKKEIERVFDGVVRRKWPMWLIAYSEGTRYTAKKHAAAEAWCKQHDKPLPKHLLYPKTKGFIATVQNLRQAAHVKAVYDVTIAYAKGNKFMSPPSFIQTVNRPDVGAEWKMYVHVKRHELASLPQSAEDLAQWLEDRWVEKGERLDMLQQRLTQA